MSVGVDRDPRTTAPVRPPSHTSRLFRLASAAAAFALWGGWAYFVNGQAAPGQDVALGGASSAFAPALTQGTGSFVITLVMIRMVTWLYRRTPSGPLRFVLPGLITVAVTGSCLIAAHTVVGTPKIARTIGPALGVALAFNIFTTVRLARVSSARDLTEEGS